MLDALAMTAAPTPFQHIETSSGIEEYRLTTNGLQVLLLPQPAAPVVAFMVTYRVGSRNESLGLTGATHFLEHLMFKGTERFNKQAGTSIFETLQRVGAQVNATTWLDRTNYYELLPNEHLALAVEIEADRMRGARLAEDDLERERTVILNEFDRYDNEPIQKLYHSVWSLAFVAHPYHHPTIGWRSDIEHATQDGLRHFYDTYYWPDNATLSIIGDFDREEALALVGDHFGGIPQAPAAWPDVHTQEPPQRGERRVVVRQSGQLGAVMVAWKTPDALHPDADALDVLAVLLASGKNSRFYRHLTDPGWTTHLFASNTRLRDPGLFYAYGLLAPEKAHEDVEVRMYGALAQVQADGVSEREMQRAKAYLRAQEAYSRDGAFSTAAQLNEAIAAGDWRLYTTYQDRIAAVTAADIQRVAQTYLQEATRTVGYYIPEVAD